MNHDFGISLAVQTMAAPHHQPELHVLPAPTWIWDPSFRYTPSYATDVRKTFERIRRHIQSQDRGACVSGKATGEKVVRLDSRKTGLT
jgi:hypothetical protein